MGNVNVKVNLVSGSIWLLNAALTKNAIYAGFAIVFFTIAAKNYYQNNVFFRSLFSLLSLVFIVVILAKTFSQLS